MHVLKKKLKISKDLQLKESVKYTIIMFSLKAIKADCRIYRVYDIFVWLHAKMSLCDELLRC